MDNKEKIIERIGKLLSLSESPNEAEAKEAAKKAHKMLADYNLSISDIKIKSEVISKTKYGGKYEKSWRSHLLNGIAHYNYCRLVILKGRNRITGSFVEYKIYGREYNIKTVLMLYDYLEATIMRIARENMKEYSFFGGFDKENFKMGMVLSILNRMEDEKLKSENALMCLSTEAAEAADKDNEHLIKVRERNGVDINGSFVAGYNEGKNISLNQQIKEAD